MKSTKCPIYAVVICQISLNCPKIQNSEQTSGKKLKVQICDVVVIIKGGWLMFSSRMTDSMQDVRFSVDYISATLREKPVVQGLGN